MENGPIPANDAQLVQLVRGALGRDARTRELPCVNVSSCKRVITLHGSLPSHRERRAVEDVVREMLGVSGVQNKIRVLQGD